MWFNKMGKHLTRVAFCILTCIFLLQDQSDSIVKKIIPEITNILRVERRVNCVLLGSCGCQTKVGPSPEEPFSKRPEAFPV